MANNDHLSRSTPAWLGIFAFWMLAFSTTLLNAQSADEASRDAETESASAASERDPVTDPSLVETIEKLIFGLDSDQFQERRAAEQQLMRMGNIAVPSMQSAVEQASGEQRERLSRILQELRRSIRMVEIQTSPSLDCVTSAAVSADGRFLYSAAWKAKAITVFEIGEDTGRLSLIETLHDAADFDGAVAIRLSQDNQLAAAVAFRAKTVTLLRRSPKTGKLTRTQTIKPDPKGPRLTFPIDASFSPDGRYLYVLDTSYAGVGTMGALFIFRVTKEDTLEFVDVNTGQQNCFANVRGIVFHPVRDQFYVTSAATGAISLVDWDRLTGSITVRQGVRDEQDGIHGLSGVMSVALSSDGRFLYSSSGRFSGDSAIGVYQVSDDGTLKVIEEFISGRDKIGNFVGGNELLVSPDGKNVYATGTRSATLAGFSRDADSGRLAFIETISLGRDLGPAGLGIRPDGKYLYVAVEASAGLAVFRRE